MVSDSAGMVVIPAGAPGIHAFGGLAHHANVADVDVAIVGVPFDGGEAGRPGARFGPEAIRRASTALHHYHPTHGVDVFGASRTIDWGDIEVAPGNSSRALDEIEGELAQIMATGARPIVLGGARTILSGELSALASVFGPVGVVMLDARTHTLDALDPAADTSSGVLRRSVLAGVVAPTRSILAGMRGPLAAPDELSWPAAAGFDVVTCEELKMLAPGMFADRVRRRVADAPAVLSVGLDVVDPAYAPATTNPEIAGLTSGELVGLLRALAGIRFTSFDVVGLTPAYDARAQVTALLAANVVFEFLGLAAIVRSV